MEDIQARPYDRAGGYVSEITFNNGQKLEIKRNDIIIFVGPNKVGKNTAAIKEYIANQLKQDKEADQMSIFDPRDPFTGSK